MKVNKPIPNTLARQTLHMALPAVLESLLIGVVDLVDMAMVSSLGLTTVAAVGVTNQPKRILLMFTLSLNIGASAVISRRIGENRGKEAIHCMQQFIIISTLMAGLLYSFGTIIAYPFMALSGANPETLDSAVLYFRLLAFGQFFQAVSLTVNACLRAEGKTRVAFITSLTSNAINLIFNYLLIYGKHGFPCLGIAGAAIAASLGNIAACAISFWSIRPGNGGVLHLEQMRGKHRLDLSVLEGTWAIIFSAFHEQFFQRLGLFLFTRIAASLGTVEFALYQFIMNLANLQGYTYDGFAVSATAMTGQSLGMRDPQRAEQSNRCALLMAYITAVGIAAALAVFRFPILRLFSKDRYIIDQGGGLLLLVAASCVPCAGAAVYGGALRGAGDTKAVARQTLWIVALFRPLTAWVMCMFFRQKGIWIAFALAHSLRCLFLWIRYSREKWKSIQL